MEESLNYVFWDNAVKSYLIVAGIVMLGFLLKRYIAHYAVSSVFLLLNKRYKKIDIDSFRQLVVKPLGLFFAVLIMVTALDKLNFPTVLDVSIYRLKLRELFRMAGTALLIVTFFRFLIRCIDFIVLLLKERYILENEPANQQLVFFFKDFIKVLLGLVSVLLLLKYVFSYDVKGLLTGLSIVGAAIALALKESLENLIASFIIFFDKPFATGDYVKGGSFSGVIERIGLRSTRLRTDAKTYITVPNKQMVDSVVDNLSNRTQRRGDLRLEISADTPIEKVNALLEEIRRILSDPAIQNFNLFFTDISSNALVITADYYTLPDNLTAYNHTRQKVNLEVMQAMETAGVDMATKTTSVHIVNNNSEKEAGLNSGQPQ